jgi:hypothetical protein
MEHGLDLHAIEDEIRRCISLCKSQEMTLAPGEIGATFWRLQTHTTPDRVCLLGAVAWVNQEQRCVGWDAYDVARARLGMTAEELAQLCRGFDGREGNASDRLYQLGQYLREEFLGR